MALTRAFEESEVPSDLRRIYADARASFDIPFVPTLFKLTAAVPAYLTTMWEDLAPVARSKEFHTASQGLEEYIRSVAVQAGWRFHDQREALAAQRFSRSDIEVLTVVISTFVHAVPRLALFARLMQRGYSGGQRGRISGMKTAAASSRLITLHVPGEGDAALRAWLIYADIKRTTGARVIPSPFRVLAPYPGYLASVWMDTKRLFHDPAFQRARDEVARRLMGYLVGLPVRDHRALARHISPTEWRDIEESVDNAARLLPQFALAIGVWQRSFPIAAGQFVAA